MHETLGGANARTPLAPASTGLRVFVLKQSCGKPFLTQRRRDAKTQTGTDFDRKERGGHRERPRTRDYGLRALENLLEEGEED